MSEISVIGAGLAGCEAAYQLAKRGHRVKLYEMKPQKKSPAHKSDGFAELVCSNSFRAARVENAVGLLKEEMRRLSSLIMSCADAAAIPAGGALAVDRTAFSKAVTERIASNPNIAIVSCEVSELPNSPCIVATGPLTSEPLCVAIEKELGASLHFFDAAAPIIDAASIDMTKAFFASRYDKGGDDYLNCPMDRERYELFWNELVNAETVELHEFETPRVFEGCMPVEVMAKRGIKTLAFGPMKPVGLEYEGRRPYAVVQLRKEDAVGGSFNMVGFQTNLKFGEQKRVFSLIPGLENAEFLRYGVMHKNTFIESPKHLNCYYQSKTNPNLFFAGQLTGVEGYVESAASGLVAGINAARMLEEKPLIDFTDCTAIGALAHYVSGYNGKDFQPMNVTFGLFQPLNERIRNKRERFDALARRALQHIHDCLPRLDI
ncbi:MAG: methylenetetrahydrofolate--tRNA-(uracil(54)-C(5))-methyltransferase (FADH(2)-oxidizing) TrmFO [Clostridia bacterium]|nr:methylenetetrahydrofolate--tRNA-(uracil(54)-C(5))-methyltransferase (FADH(2)-oxidizing) TrmFO [Clostridia bacterium]